MQDGASIGFVLPFTVGDSEAFWKGNVLPAVHSGTRVLLIAQQEGKIPKRPRPRSHEEAKNCKKTRTANQRFGVAVWGAPKGGPHPNAMRSEP